MAPQVYEGSYFVVPTATARMRGWKLCEGKMREYQRLRKQAFKLAYWPSGNDGESGADLDWDWIRSLEKERIGELRIGETINHNDNLRVIFFKTNQRLPNEPLNRIWLLTVFQKKRGDFSNSELKAFRACRTLIVQRYYSGSATA